MASAIGRQVILVKQQRLNSRKKLVSANHLISETVAFSGTNRNDNASRKLRLFTSSHRNLTLVAKSSSPGKTGGSVSVDDEGVSLGTMTLPPTIDVPRFETLLFQWANSLCQGAQLPLPVPLKVDKIEGGVRLGFAEIDDGKTQVFAHIDCVVIPGSKETDAPKFVATRNGAMKNKVPPGEPRIMKSLLAALQKSVQIATTAL
ncbi:hypothetical protein RND81_04G128900 [Saponaria officinalis]|uniref:DUF7148 domain-containing protein n=1 Tax=Saponaria officinalis TaxID=3572 RepID=A0AAW1LKD6_SAPOF